MLSVENFSEIEDLISVRKGLLEFLRDAPLAKKLTLEIPSTDKEAFRNTHCIRETDASNVQKIIDIVLETAKARLAEVEAKITGYGVALPEQAA